MYVYVYVYVDVYAYVYVTRSGPPPTAKLTILGTLHHLLQKRWRGGLGFETPPPPFAEKVEGGFGV